MDDDVSIVANPGWGQKHMVDDNLDLDASVAVELPLLQRTLSRYAFSYDNRDPIALRSVFSEDVEWSATVADQAIYGPFVGRDAVMSFMVEAMEAQTDQRRHLLVNRTIREMNGNVAHVDAYLLLMSAGDGHARTVATGFYSFWLRRVEKTWLICRVRLCADTAM